jgi:hypothetical protein
MKDRSKQFHDLLSKFQEESHPQLLKQRLEGIAQGQGTPRNGQLESHRTSLESMEATRSLGALNRLERGQSIDGESQFMLKTIVAWLRRYSKNNPAAKAAALAPGVPIDETAVNDRGGANLLPCP